MSSRNHYDPALSLIKFIIYCLFLKNVFMVRFTLLQIAVDGTMSVAQAFIDEDEEESFYATAWTHSVSASA